jgi:hypothetical protein
MNGEQMKLIGALTCAALLTACATPVPPVTTTIIGSPAKIRGLLEVRISGNDTISTASARFVKASNPRASGLQTQAISVIDDTGLKFKRRAVSFIDSDNAGQSVRNTQAVFDVENTTTGSLNNLTLYAINVPNLTIAGTSVASMFAGDGSALNDAALARSLQPTHGMQAIAGGLAVQPTLADLQWVQPAEASSVQTQAAALPTAINGDVLEYGFVARNATFPELRYFGPGDGGTCPAEVGGEASLCKGTVTLAYSFPVNASAARSTRLWAFSLYFVVADQDTNVFSQSLEEQAAGTVTGLDAASVSGTQRVLFGSGLTAGVEVLCRVKTAVPTATNPTAVSLGAPLGTPGCP